MNTLKKSLAVLAMFGLASSVSADERSTVLVTANQSKGSTELVVELANDSKTVGVQLELVLEGVNAAAINASNCVVSKSSNQMSSCKMAGNVMKFAMVDGGLNPVDSGRLMTLTIPNSAITGELKVSPRLFLAADKSANEYQGELMVEQIDGKLLSNLANEDKAR